MIEQGSIEWLKVRQGMLTCSRLYEVVSRSPAYARQLHRERTEEVEPVIYSREPAALAWGHRNEPRAVAAYEMSKDCEVAASGFGVHSSLPFFGGSPDGLVGDDGMVEIKCPIDPGLHQVTIVCGWSHPNRQGWQVQGLLEVFDRSWCDFVSYDPRREPHPDALIIRRKWRDIQLWETRGLPAVEWFNDWVNRGEFSTELLLGDVPNLF